jgi:hypothetical protein
LAAAAANSADDGFATGFVVLTEAAVVAGVDDAGAEEEDAEVVSVFVSIAVAVAVDGAVDADNADDDEEVEDDEDAVTLAVGPSFNANERTRVPSERRYTQMRLLPAENEPHVRSMSDARCAG